MKSLERRVGDFRRKEGLTVEQVIETKNRILEKLDVDDFLNNVELGFTAYDELMVAYYDYLDGGIGSVYVYVSVVEDDGEYRMDYAVASEYQGNVTTDGEISFGEEERLLSALHDTLLASTKDFAELSKNAG